VPKKTHSHRNALAESTCWTAYSKGNGGGAASSSSSLFKLKTNGQQQSLWTDNTEKVGHVATHAENEKYIQDLET